MQPKLPRQVVRNATAKLKVVQGKRGGSDVVKGTFPAKHIYVYHVNPEVTSTNLKDLITGGGFQVRGIRRISKDDWLHGAFKVDINAGDLERTLDEDFWPEGISCREWMAFIPRPERDIPQHG
jgi:hypothetical protein